MYLVVEPLTQTYVFMEEDPRNDGYAGPLEQEVKLDESRAPNRATSDSTTAVPCLGRSPEDAKHYVVFQSNRECRKAGFEPVASIYARYKNWGEFEQD